MRRRDLLASVALTAFAKPFEHPLGINLYTVRGPLANNPAATYKALGEIGIKELEVRPPQLLQHAAMMRDAGLKPVHMFIDSSILTGAWEEWQQFMGEMAARMKQPAPPAPQRRATLDEMIGLAKQHGVQRIGTSMLLPKERGTAIAAINNAVKQCAAQGIELYYHNHAFEFEGARGQRFLDRLHREADPRLRLELDVFWAAIGGDDPVAVLKNWKGRVRSVHLKDVANNAPLGVREIDMPPAAFQEPGKGKLDFRAILRAAKKAGVEHYFIELDYSPGDPLVSVRNAYAHLKGLAV